MSQGSKVTAYDPVAMPNAGFYFKDSIRYAEEEYAALNGSDALLVVTEWNEFRTPDFASMKSKLRKAGHLKTPRIPRISLIWGRGIRGDIPLFDTCFFGYDPYWIRRPLGLGRRIAL